jgi:hypothetical protein
VIVPNVLMGALIDSEPDGQPDATATGDDLANLDDEDGVTFVTPLDVGDPAQVDVVVSVAGHLDAWIDYDGNGVWEAVESIYSAPVGAGLNPIGFVVPNGAAVGQTFARFRFNTVGPLPPDGPAQDGEVEDYEVTLINVVSVPGDANYQFDLRPGVPNPFTTQFSIEFSIPRAEFVRLKVFSIQGRLVTTLVSKRLPPGIHNARWDGRDDRGRRTPPGIYIYRLQAGEQSETRKVNLVR